MNVDIEEINSVDLFSPDEFEKKKSYINRITEATSNNPNAKIPIIIIVMNKLATIASIKRIKKTKRFDE